MPSGGSGRSSRRPDLDDAIARLRTAIKHAPYDSHRRAEVTKLVDELERRCGA
jgi:hypothetical protein